MYRTYLPEGMLSKTQSNAQYLSSLTALEDAFTNHVTLEAVAALCDRNHNLILDLGDFRGTIPREECALGIASGQTRDIAIISRVGKPVCFKIQDIDYTADPPEFSLSRVAAQKEALSFFLQNLFPGKIIPAMITHLDHFGAFVDIGCGVVSLIGIENISVSRIFHPSERFHEGQQIYAVVSQIDEQTNRIFLTHKELLGTWEENAGEFYCGETVTGIVRSVEDYGIFIELTPNLSGLAEYRSDVAPGQSVSVYIKSIIPEKMKIKLAVIDVITPPESPSRELRYRFTGDSIQNWIYSPSCCASKYIHTQFCE